MSSTIVHRIERELEMTGLVDALACRLSASDLRSVLMEVHRIRAERAKETAILDHATRDPLMAPCIVNARNLMAFDSVAFQAASEFDALDLSPVCPFSAAFTLGGTSQNNVLTALRNAEVLGDSTISMAIEACRRRASADVVRLCASHRVIRLQPFDQPGYAPHFRLFALVTAGRDRGSFSFEMAHLVEHVRVYLQMFRRLADVGLMLRSPLVEFTDMIAVEAGLAAAGITQEEVRRSVRAHWRGGSERFLRERGISTMPDAANPKLKTEVIPALANEFNEAQFRVNQQRLEGLGYYPSFAFQISPEAPDGKRYSLVDGGFTDWTARLMGNRKERLLISGMGSELACKAFSLRHNDR